MTELANKRLTDSYIYTFKQDGAPAMMYVLHQWKSILTVYCYIEACIYVWISIDIVADAKNPLQIIFS